MHTSYTFIKSEANVLHSKRPTTKTRRSFWCASFSEFSVWKWLWPCVHARRCMPCWCGARTIVEQKPKCNMGHREGNDEPTASERQRKTNNDKIALHTAAALVAVVFFYCALSTLLMWSLRRLCNVQPKKPRGFLSALLSSLVLRLKRSQIYVSICSWCSN